MSAEIKPSTDVFPFLSTRSVGKIGNMERTCFGSS